MPRWRVEVQRTEENTEWWLVDAATADEARANWFDGDFEDDEHGETLDTQVIRIREIDPATGNELPDIDPRLRMPQGL